ncbi:MAG: Fe-S cluster assembly protein SufD [Magnetococcales bacterium]|nr:Fe-S cluster assembly protein SufD [Magnetococcales bacterium]
MSSALHTYQREFHDNSTHLPGWNAWQIRRSRQAAMQRVMQTDLPTQKLENWKYTSTRRLSQTPYALYTGGCVGLYLEDLDPFLVDRQASHRLVFINGLLSRRLSCLDDLPNAVQVASMARIADESPAMLSPWLEPVLTGHDQGFAELNQALWLDGAFVHIPAGVQLIKPLQLLFLTTPFQEPIVTFPWNLVIVGKSAQALVIESYLTLGQGAHFSNARTTLVLEPQARLEHLLLLGESELAWHVGSVQATQKEGSRLDSRIFAAGGELTRQELQITLAGAEAECFQEGLFLAGRRQHMDLHSWLHHTCSNTRSRQLFKSVLDGHARGVFNGVIRIPPDLQNIQAEQKTANLLLTDTAEIDAKPQLEIHSDAVQCSHGATVGGMNPEAMFYLQSRGLDVDAARLLLIQGFADELLQTIKPAPVQEWLRQRLNQERNLP